MNDDNHNRIALPNQMNIETMYADGPLAQPCSLMLQQPGQMKMIVMGGLTKVEALAGQIAGAMLQEGVLNCTHPDVGLQSPSIKSGAFRDAEYQRRVATHAVDLAYAILAECKNQASMRQAVQEDSE